MAQKPRYDIVMTGDSRTANGLAPAVMASVLKDYRIFNFGFWGCGYSRYYLEEAEKLLDPASPKKIIVIGITSLSLTPAAAADNVFMDVRREDPFERWFNVHFGPVVAFFEPYKLPDFFSMLSGRKSASVVHNHYHTDGWAAVNIEPPSPKYEQDSIRIYRKFFTGNKVSEEQVDVVMRFVSKWSDSGVRVFGLRFIGSEAVTGVENSMSGFDEAGFIKKFEAAGGVWIPLDNSLYKTVDGSHLAEESARRLSADVAGFIAKKVDSGQ